MCEVLGYILCAGLLEVVFAGQYEPMVANATTK